MKKALIKFKNPEKEKICINGDKGSSSVLVILIMLTLVVFGLLALMSTYSGLKLSRKNAEWTKEYYALDARAEAQLAKIDSCLFEAEEASQAYISSKAYEKQESSLMKSDCQKEIHQGWQSAVDGNKENEFIKSLHTKLYYTFAVEKLKAAANEEYEVNTGLDFSNAGGIFAANAVIPDKGVVTVNGVVEEGKGEESRKLLFRLSAVESDAGNPGKAQRYKITAWKELPKTFKYDESLEFEDLEVE
jgi:hypothetical protein